jgi:hypothetical protein
MGFPGEPPRRQPYNQPDASPPTQGEHWFDASPHNRAPEGARAAQGAWPPPSQPQQPPSPPQQPPHHQERPRQERWSPYDEGPRSRRPIYIAVGALAALIAGGIGLAMLANSDPPAATSTASPPAADSRAPAPNTPDDKFGFATARKTDPLLLTLNEVFKNKKVKIGGQSYLMTTRRAY